ncbi:MAG: hypothetical protein JXR73_20020 [Candidatus Omnitrophica bacterium]|nr:hypothetical protein [Candidatus Omnitrophota bacterium]
MKKVFCTAAIGVILCLGMAAQANAAVQYSNDFENPSSSDPTVAWPEWVMFGGGSAQAVNGRIEWDATGGNNDWLRLDQELPDNYVFEFDFFYQEDRNGRFSVWPFCNEGDSIFESYNYFMRKNTHFFNGADTTPSEGSFDMTLPLDANPHRMRVEVTGDHVLLLYKNQGEGGWILMDDRDFPAKDNPRYVQLGYNSDDGVAGAFFIDNFTLSERSSNQATVERSIEAADFVANTPVPVSLTLSAGGAVPSLTITEDFPENWTAENISNGGVLSDGVINWSFSSLDESLTLTYDAVPPRLILNQDAIFSGSVNSGNGDDRIVGDTLLSVELPYLYRESIDYDFSGSPVDGKNYPTGTEYGVLYCQDRDGIPSDQPYERPGDGSAPAIDAEYNFPADADFYQGSPEMSTFLSEAYTFAGYRDEGEAWLEKGASDTGTNLGSIDAGDWFRYTFDLGDGDQVLIVNVSVNTWHSADNFPGVTENYVDVYVDNKFKGEIEAPVTSANEFNFFTVGPFEVSGGEHSIVIAFPGEVAPCMIGRLEVVRIEGIGRVERKLTEDGFFEPGAPVTVSLTADSLYGTYTPIIEEIIPDNVQVSDLGGGELVGDRILFNLDPTTTSQTVTYTVTPPEGVKFLLFDGLCDVGLPLAKTVFGDVSVTNEVWLFGDPTEESTDDFEGSDLSEPWFVEYGSDPALSTDYEEGVVITLADGLLTFEADTISMPDKFNEWSGGRRAPMILRNDVPEGDWRIETSLKLNDVFARSEFHVGLAVTYNEAGDADITKDEYLFGFYGGEIRVERTNDASLGALGYHEITDEYDWLESVWDGNVEAKIAVTKRSDELIFSAQLPGNPWQLVGAPVSETRQPTRVGLFSKVWGSECFSITEFDYFALNALDEFTGVEAWELY